VVRQLIGGENRLRGDLKGHTESEIRAAKNQTLQTKYHSTKILQRKTENKCRVNSLMRQWNASYRHVQYRQKNNIYRDIIQYVLNCTVSYRRKNWGRIIQQTPV